MRSMFGVCACAVASFLLPLAAIAPAAAQTACESYTVRAGDNLTRIARASFGDGRKWTLIYQANIEVIGRDPNLILIGDVFRIPCTSDGPIANEGWTPGGGKEITLLTADDYSPFTDRGLPNGGLVTEIVDAAMGETVGEDRYGISWENDWSRHLEPLLAERRYDMGFPWLRPDCEATPDNMRCANFVFSEPMFEMLVLLFVDGDRPFRFTSDDDIVGKTLCRPAGYYTHDLDKDGRNWLRDDKITLISPSGVDDCFRLLGEGLVDAVALNEFTGRSAMQRLGIEEDVEIIQTRPLSIEGLHVLVHKDHPQANALIEMVNDGIAALRRSGEYTDIVDKHMSNFWAQLDS